MSFNGWGRINRRTKWHWFVNGIPACETPTLMNMSIPDLQVLLLRYEGHGIKDAIDQRYVCKECYRLKIVG